MSSNSRPRAASGRRYRIQLEVEDHADRVFLAIDHALVQLGRQLREAICVTCPPTASMAATICRSGGVRIFKPCMSAGVFTGRFELVMLRKPHSQVESMTMPCLSMRGATQAWNGPSSTRCASA